MSNIILCIDMDAFFASVEQQSNPTLRGKPVAVIGSGARTVITTRSYEARQYGVKTGMNVYEAKKLCPHLILVVGNNEKYTHTCRELVKICHQFTPDVEVYSIDEAFLDVTTTHHLFRGPEAIATAIREIIKNQFGITCTVGIAPNILLAKLASDMAKPDGIKWIKPEAVASLLDGIPVKDLWGIGSKLALRLEALGIRSCGELGKAPASLLRYEFGIIGEHLKNMGMGICSRPLHIGEEDPKSIGHSMTFPQDLSERREIEAEILKLSEMVGRRARRYGFIGRKVSLTIRYQDFETFTKQTTFGEHTNHTHEIFGHAISILNKITMRDAVRLLGVCLSGLVKDQGQMILFEEKRRKNALLQAVDSVNDRFGDFKITWASYLQRREAPRVISPAWKPSGVRNVHVRR
jgi:DNA polymerase-4